MQRASRARWYSGLGSATLIGLVVLGGGGRLAMRAISSLNGAPGSWTAEGTLTVLLAGAASGLGGGIIRALADLARGLSRNARFAMFAAACLALTLRGLNPLDTTRLALFLPLVAVYLVAVEWVWRKDQGPRESSATV